jgi:hypothetical protein
MAQEQTVSIRPAAGGPHLKKNASLEFRQHVLEVTDPRGRTRRFDLSDGDGPYEFRYGTWQGEADFAMIDRSGHAVLLLDQKSFHLGDITRLQEATGLKCDESGARPPKRRDTVEIVNLPYLKIGYAVFAAGSVAFGLWSVTHIEFFVLGVTLPAVIMLIPLLVVGRRAMLSGEDFKAEYAKLRPEVNETLALADQWLAERGQSPVHDDHEPHQRATPEPHSPTDPSPHGS